jgi:hypothetical protein
MSLDWQNRLLDLIEKKFDDRLNVQEVEELEHLVLQNEGAAKLYAELAQEHALLTASSEHLRENVFVDIEPKQRSVYRQVMLAAGLLLAFALTMLVTQKKDLPDKASFAIITQSNYARWGECTLPTAMDSTLTSGKLKLLEGLVTLTFSSGAEMVLEGPVELDLIDAMNTRLHSGIAVTEIPESAKGFTILTPTSKAIDHGTKFLTQVSSNGESTLVNVLEGEVEVVHDLKGAHHIFGGEMIKTTDKQLVQDNFVDEIGLIENPSSTQPSLKISTSHGRGDDGTAYKMNLDYHYNSELIMIKNSHNDYHRKGYMKFDLTDLSGRSFRKVHLDLFMVHSQHGSLALSQPIARFSLHAVINESLDLWDGGLMKWERAPANIVNTNGLDANSTVKLGEFELERGQVSGKVSFDSEKLNQVIRRDQNGLLTLVIVQETLGDQIGNNYVYAIASKKHSSVLAPTLNFHF